MRFYERRTSVYEAYTLVCGYLRPFFAAAQSLGYFVGLGTVDNKVRANAVNMPHMFII